MMAGLFRTNFIIFYSLVQVFSFLLYKIKTGSQCHFQGAELELAILQLFKYIFWPCCRTGQTAQGVAAGCIICVSQIVGENEQCIWKIRKRAAVKTLNAASSPQLFITGTCTDDSSHAI